MKSNIKQNNSSVVIPLKVVTGMIAGLMIVFFLYIVSNYVIAAPLQQPLQHSCADHTSENASSS